MKMALQKQLTDEFGEIYPNAYFRVVQRNFNDTDKTGQIVFYAYENAAKKGKRIIGQKAYTVTPELFDEYFDDTKQKAVGKTSKASAYDLAKAVKDTGEGESAKSFFDGALDV